MRQYKESEWRDEVEFLKTKDYPPYTAISEALDRYHDAKTRGAIIYFYFNLPESCQTDRYYIISTRRRLKAIRKERRKRVIDKIRQWHKSLKAKIYRWLLKREYKRIMRQDQTK